MMTVRELMEMLSRMDQDKQVTVWCGEWDCTNPIDEVKDDGDEVIIF
jgi:hypothetical protein